MEPSLQLLIGPPGTGKEKDLFYKHQALVDNGKINADDGWGSVEIELVRQLFSRSDERVSLFDELCSQVLGTPVSINHYFCIIEHHLGAWVATISIQSSDVTFSERHERDWPPPEASCELIAASLSYIWERQWIQYRLNIPEEILKI